MKKKIFVLAVDGALKTGQFLYSITGNNFKIFGYNDNDGYDYNKVKILTYLIFLNIAPLHYYLYSLLLFYLGKYNLHNTLEQRTY